MNERFRPTKRTEHNYFRDIYEILRRWFLTGEDHPIGTPVSLIGPIENLERWAWQAAQRMVTGLAVENARSWQAAARESMRGRELYEALRFEMRGPVGRRVRQLVMENASLIRSLPEDVAKYATRMALRHQQTGERAPDIARLIKQESRTRAMLIARTEVGKATTALTEARAESLDLPWYVWETSQDQRVRPSHRKMQGVLVRWNDPPNPEALAGEPHRHGPYTPGNIWNCRCYPAPLLTLDQIAWPHKVYRFGIVRYMTRSQFARIESAEEVAA